MSLHPPDSAATTSIAKANLPKVSFNALIVAQNTPDAYIPAEKAYKEAAGLAPEDPAPWSNISAIKFEQGDYSAALASIDKAVALTKEPDDSAKKQKLYTRMAKCHLHNLALQDAENAAAKLGSDGQSRALRSSIKELQTLWNMEPEEGTFRKHILDRFPRYKGVL